MHRRLRPAAFVVLSAVLAVALWAAGFQDAAELLLTFGPLIALVAPLLAGRYVGEALLAVRIRRSRRVRPVAARLPRAPETPRLSGGRLLAHALAERGPPALGAACC